MINQRDNFFWYKLNGLLRNFIVRGGSKLFFKHIIINEYPKSGGTWIGQMLAEATGLPFPRNRLPMFRDSIMHGHYLSTIGMNNVLVVWRDGRDVVVSQYYHWLFGTEICGRAQVERHRSRLQFTDYNDIVMNLPRFIRYVFEEKTHPRFSWADFVDKWLDTASIFVKYEDMRLQPVNELCRIVYELTDMSLTKNVAEQIIDKFSFEKQSGRKEGHEKKGSFMRKGIVGDWNNYFSDESRTVFKDYAGRELMRLGYEIDLDW